MSKSEITIEKQDRSIFRIACSTCNTLTNHKCLTSVKYHWEVDEYEIQGVDRYRTIVCLGCDTISFRKSSSNSDDFYEEEGNLIYTETEEIYPNRIVGRAPLSEQYYLPEKVRNVYKETHAALTSKLKILAGVGVRGLIEAICIEEKAKGTNLKEKIDDLVKIGILTSANAVILHKTRFLGNKSAHELEIAKDQELGIAFDITENILQNLYIIPKKAQSLGK